MKTQMCFLLILLTLPVFSYGQTQTDDSIDGSFSNPTDLTDKQMDDAKNFTHQGLKDQAYKDGCKSINDCKDDEGFPLEMIIGKAYAVIGMMSGGGGMIPTLTKGSKGAGAASTSGSAAGGSEAGGSAAGGSAAGGSAAGGAAGGTAGATGAAAEKETTPDYCMMVAMANETFGGMIQQSLQKQDENQAVGGDVQMQALISLRQTHKTRAKTATFQAGVYTGVTACYGVMLATKMAAPDWKTIAKMGGSAALMTLYWKKVSKHKKAVKKIEAVMASMETAGKGCNPWTKTPCFCKEATSKTLYPVEYEEVCVLNKGNFETPKIALGCAAVNGNKMSYDKECKCKQTNSCLKSGLKAYNPKFGLGNNMMNDVNKTFDMLGSGEFDEGRLSEARLNASAMASKMKLKGGSKVPKPNLTAEQKKMADALKPYMPEALANVAAASDSNYNGGIADSAGSPAISKLPASVKEKLADAINVNYKQGGGFSAVADEPGFEMPMMPGQAAEKANGTEIVSFAEQAVSKADVSNAPETPIFDIISNRYRRSGWQKLDRFEE